MTSTGRNVPGCARPQRQRRVQLQHGDIKHHGRPCKVVSEKPSTIQEPSDSGAPTHDQPAVALHVPQLLLQPRVLLLFLQQPPLHSAQLLLGLTLDVIGHHHRRLQVCLEAPPLLGFLLKMPDPPTHTHIRCPPGLAPYQGLDPLCPTLRKTSWAVLVRRWHFTAGKRHRGSQAFVILEFSILKLNSRFNFTSSQY